MDDRCIFGRTSSSYKVTLSGLYKLDNLTLVREIEIDTVRSKRTGHALQRDSSLSSIPSAQYLIKG